MFKQLKIQLFVSSMLALCILLAGVYFVTRGHMLPTVGMIVIVFLALLFVNLIGQMIAMATNIYREITFRL